MDAFDGKHGLFWHNYRSKTDRYVKVGYHEGLVDADVWLAVQDKFSHHHIPLRKGKVLRSWMSGLLRCGHCDHAVKVDYTYNKIRATVGGISLAAVTTVFVAVSPPVSS